jgi:PIN domain nuclease of toxin-antitoxin system
VLAAAEDGQGIIYVPTIALVEIFEAARRGIIELAGGVAVWTENLFATGGFFPADLTTDIVLRAEALYAIPERGDRLIAATAAVMQCGLISRDPEIARAASVSLVW